MGQRSFHVNGQNKTVRLAIFSRFLQNNTQLCLYPLMTVNSAQHRNAQVQMEVDDIAITPPVTSVFHFEDAAGNMKTDFCEGENIFLDGTASFGENQYYQILLKDDAMLKTILK